MEPNLTNIKNIVFDLGNVLLNLDFDASIQAFQKLGLNSEVVNRQQAYADPVFYELEVGKTTPQEFRKRVRRILNNPEATDQQIDDAWCAMIHDIPAKRVQMLKELAKNYNVYLFSNTNAIHINRLHGEFREIYGIEFPSLFVKDFYSHELHERKPDLASYTKVIELSGIIPGETLFVDDLEKNISGAEKAGLKTFWLKDGMEVSEVFTSKF
ncbi:MAG: HAD family phosphatase [Mariniphaga sp.]|jgi:putative hydrolase of the HAD superfamily|nr:HAD family phosphatase [Mariniphaga sp.]